LVNQLRRKSLKTIAGATAGVTAAALSPLSFAGMKSMSGQAAISIPHVDTVFGRTLFIQNLSDETVKLESLSPGRFATPSGQFDLNSLLVDGGLEIQPATTQAHNIAQDGRVHNWAVWDTLDSASSSLVTKGQVRPVNIFVHDQSLAAAPKQIPSSGVTLTHYSNFQGRTVLLRNTTDRRLSLYKLSPQKIVTPDGDIDLEAMLESGALSIPANTTQALSISDTGKVERHASWTHLGAGIPVESVNTDIQSVTVTGKYDGMREISATSVHLATVTVS